MASNGSKPRIGLTTYLEPASFGVWHQESALLPRSYVDAVVRAGGVPVLLPPIGDAVIDGLDGLLVSGGPDVDPARYGAEPHPETDAPRLERDAFEVALLKAAIDADVPILAICRGAQLLNVAAGGTLTQHLPELVSHDGHRPVPGKFGTTLVRLHPNSRLHHILGPEVEVKCHHHQVIGWPSEQLAVAGWADDGLVIEAVEIPDPRFIVGVQWHPEESLDDLRLFRAFVDAARERSA